MMLRSPLLGVCLALAGAALMASCAAKSAPCPLDPEYAAIISAGGEHCFRVDLVDTPEERAQGLMFVRHMEEDRGMLFLFDRVSEQPFWMKNTYISLDIIFIAPGGRIVNIAERMEPLSERSIVSAEPIAAALEINGGLAERLGIRPGDRVRHPALEARPDEAPEAERGEP